MNLPSYRSWLPRIAPEEAAPTAIATAYFFLLMATYYILKPVRSSLFLHEFSANELPYVYLLVLVTIMGAAWLYDRLVRVFRLGSLVPWATVFFAGHILIFWGLLALGLQPASSAAHPVATAVVVAPNAGPGAALAGVGTLSSAVTLVYFVWVSVFNLFVVMMFWSLSNRCFNSEQGSRLYGLVGGGGVAGALVGSALTNVLSHRLHTENLLLISAAILLPTAVLARRLFAYGASDPDHERTVDATGSSSGVTPGGPALDAPDTGAAPDATAPARGSGWRLVVEDPYVRAIGLVIFLYTLVGTIFDYQFSAIVKATIPRKDDVTAYFGAFFLVLNVTALLVQIFLTGPVQKRWGPKPGLTSLPCIALVGSLLILAWPLLIVATAVGVVGQAVTYSIHQASKELLYLPTTEAVKVRAKAVIDTFIFRAGDAAASLMILFWNGHKLGEARQMFWIVGPASVLWLLTAIGLSASWRRRVPVDPGIARISHTSP